MKIKPIYSMKLKGTSVQKMIYYKFTEIDCVMPGQFDLLTFSTLKCFNQICNWTVRQNICWRA